MRITGFLEDADVPAHIAACDLLVYPATHADSSYSLVTGLAYGCAPIVASDVYGHREVAERKAGIALFRQRAIAGSVGRGSAPAAGQRPSSAAALLAEARAYAAATTWTAVAAQTRQVYLQAQQDWQQKQAAQGDKMTAETHRCTRPAELAKSGRHSQPCCWRGCWAAGGWAARACGSTSGSPT